jgi:predicted membrane protein
MQNPNNPQAYMQNHFEQQQRGRLMTGLVLVGAGGLWLAKQAGVAIPGWLLSWPMILIAIGVIQWVQHAGKKMSAYVLLLIGGIFMAEKFVPDLHLGRIAWPLVVILVGIGLILRSGFSGRKKEDATASGLSESFGLSDDSSSEELLRVNAIFGGVQKSVISKHFRGGQLNCVFGGAELNLERAELQGKAVLDINAIFGGVELRVPADWIVRSEITAILGGVEDGKPAPDADAGSNRVLILKGLCAFGGVEIKRY